MTRPPTTVELIGYPEPFPGSDEQYVVKNFLDKTQDDARQMYLHGGMYITEDFTYMASAGLRYYLPPAFDYLRDDESADDWEFCHGLLCSLSCQADRPQRLAADVLLLMKEIASYCDAQREKFGVEAENDLFEKYIRKIGAA
ncbi:MAG: hypothetical protein RIC55_34260 [Pirellulaceae bacterium]